MLVRKPDYADFVDEKTWSFLQKHVISQGILSRTDVLRVLELFQKGNISEAEKVGPTDHTALPFVYMLTMESGRITLLSGADLEKWSKYILSIRAVRSATDEQTFNFIMDNLVNHFFTIEQIVNVFTLLSQGKTEEARKVISPGPKQLSFSLSDFLTKKEGLFVIIEAHQQDLLNVALPRVQEYIDAQEKIKAERELRTFFTPQTIKFLTDLFNIDTFTLLELVKDYPASRFEIELGSINEESVLFDLGSYLKKHKGKYYIADSDKPKLRKKVRAERERIEHSFPATVHEPGTREALEERIAEMDSSILAIQISFEDQKRLLEIIQLLKKGKLSEAKKLYKKLSGTKKGIYHAEERFFTSAKSSEEAIIFFSDLLPKIPEALAPVFIRLMQNARELYALYSTTGEESILKKLQYFETFFPVYYLAAVSDYSFVSNWQTISPVLSKSTHPEISKYYGILSSFHQATVAHFSVLESLLTAVFDPTVSLRDMEALLPSAFNSVDYLQTLGYKARYMASLISIASSLIEYTNSLSSYTDSDSLPLNKEISKLTQRIFLLLQKFNSLDTTSGDSELLFQELIEESEAIFSKYKALSQKFTSFISEKRGQIPEPPEMVHSLSLSFGSALEQNRRFILDLESIASAKGLSSLTGRYFGLQAEMLYNISLYGDTSRQRILESIQEASESLSARAAEYTLLLKALETSFEDQEKLKRIHSLLLQGKGSEARAIYLTLEGDYGSIIRPQYFSSTFLKDPERRKRAAEAVFQSLPWQLMATLLRNPELGPQLEQTHQLLLSKNPLFIERLWVLGFPEEFSEQIIEIGNLFTQKNYKKAEAVYEKLIMEWVSLSVNQYVFTEPLEKVQEMYNRAETGERYFRYLLDKQAAIYIYQEAQHLMDTRYPALFQFLDSSQQFGIRHSKMSVSGYEIELEFAVGSTTRKELRDLIFAQLEKSGFFKDPRYSFLLKKEHKKTLELLLENIQNIRSTEKVDEIFEFGHGAIHYSVTLQSNYMEMATTGETLYSYDAETQQAHIRAWKDSASVRTPPISVNWVDWTGADAFVFNPHQPQRDTYYNLFLSNLSNALGGVEGAGTEVLAELRRRFDPAQDISIEGTSYSFNSHSETGSRMGTIFQAYDMLRVSGIDQAHSMDYDSGRVNYRSPEYTMAVMLPIAEQYLKSILGLQGYQEFLQNYEPETRFEILRTLYFLLSAEADLLFLESFMDTVKEEMKKDGIDLHYLLSYSAADLESESQKAIREKYKRWGFKTEDPSTERYTYSLPAKVIKLRESLKGRREELIGLLQKKEKPKKVMAFIDRKISNIDEREEPLDPACVLDNYTILKTWVFNAVHEEIIGEKINRAIMERLRDMSFFDYFRKLVSDNAVTIIAGSGAVGGVIGGIAGSAGGPGGTVGGAVAGAKTGVAIGSGIVAACGLTYVVEGLYDEVSLRFAEEPTTFEGALTHYYDTLEAREKLFTGLVDVTVGRFGLSAPVKQAGKKYVAQKVLHYTMNTFLVGGASYRLSYTVPEAISGEGSWTDVVMTVPFFVIGAGGLIKTRALAQGATISEVQAMGGFKGSLVKVADAPAWLLKPAGLSLNLAFTLALDSDVHDSFSRAVDGSGSFLQALESVSKGWTHTTGEFIAFDVYIFGPFRLLKPIAVRLAAERLPAFLRSSNMRALAYLKTTEFHVQLAETLGVRQPTEAQAKAIYELLYSGEALTREKAKAVLGKAFTGISDDALSKFLTRYTELIGEAKMVAGGSIPSKAIERMRKTYRQVAGKPPEVVPVKLPEPRITTRGLGLAFTASEFGALIGFGAGLSALDNALISGKKDKYYEAVANILVKQGITNADEIIHIAIGYLNFIIREIPAREFYTSYFEHLPDHLKRMDKELAIKELEKNYPEITMNIFMNYIYSLMTQADSQGVNPAIAVSLFLYNILDGGKTSVPMQSILEDARRVDEFMRKHSTTLGREYTSYSFEEITLLWKAIISKGEDAVLKGIKEADFLFVNPSSTDFIGTFRRNYFYQYLSPEVSEEISRVFSERVDALLAEKGLSSKELSKDDPQLLEATERAFDELYSIVELLRKGPVPEGFFETEEGQKYSKELYEKLTNKETKPLEAFFQNERRLRLIASLSSIAFSTDPLERTTIVYGLLSGLPPSSVLVPHLLKTAVREGRHSSPEHMDATRKKLLKTEQEFRGFKKEFKLPTP
ncbi:MAG: hypothetical protein PHU63_01035 [Candidatus ainarchaeum sp.]|nr:hypothetical protein [Candidatus ainarchaeum sp.]